MKSIAEIFDNGNQMIDSIHHFFDRYIGSKLLRKCGISKIVDKIIDRGCSYDPGNPFFRLLGGAPMESKVIQKVVKAKDLLIDKILLCFASGSAYRMFQHDSFYGDYGKDTFYRFDLLPKANWERLEETTALNVILDIESRTKEDHTNVLIFDDSLNRRTGGKGTELCGRVYDHNDHKLRIGYRMMTGGWSNSEMFIPFAQSMLTTRDNSLMLGPDEQIDGRTLRGKRRKMAKTKGTEVVQAMVEKAKALGIPFDYVLFDTWFSNPAQLISLRSIDVDTIAMIKKNSTKYTWKDPSTEKEMKLNVKEIYSRNKKRRGLSKYLLSVEVTISDSDGNLIPARLVYARNRNNRKNWVCFACTDMTLDEETILRTYSIRWQIETYFKMTKSYLKLCSECHSTSYDAITSHMVVVAIRYMILAVERFNNSDNRSVEDLFYQVQRDVINQMVNVAIVTLLDILIDSIRDFFHATEEQIDALICKFVDRLPDAWKCRFQKPEPVRT